jgi:hypothetical protein
MKIGAVSESNRELRTENYLAFCFGGNCKMRFLNRGRPWQ